MQHLQAGHWSEFLLATDESQDAWPSIQGFLGLRALDIWEFPKLGVPYFGVLIIRILLFRVLY